MSFAEDREFAGEVYCAVQASVATKLIEAHQPASKK